MKILRYLAAYLQVMIASSMVVFSQQQEKLIVVEHADSLVGSEINGERIKQLIGHVKLRQGRTVITCERAVQYIDANRFTMEGVVEVRDDTMRMVGNRGIYYGDTRVAEAFDRVLLEEPGTTLRAAHGKYFMNQKKACFDTNVSVEDTASVLTSDELTYFREEEKTVAQGKVKILNSTNGMTILGDHFENFRKRKYSKMTIEPRLIQVGTSSGGKKDTLIVSAAVLESFQDSTERLIATDSVKIIRSGMAAEAGISTYYTYLDSIVLQRSPYVWYTAAKSEENQVSGDSIFIKLNKRKLERVYVRGRAVAISRADSLYPGRFNQMTGREIIMSFEGENIKQIEVNTTATSLYYLFDRGSGNGMNKTSGDHVTMTFAEGGIDKIKVITGAEGQYFPEKLIRGREAEYNLPGFNWRYDRPGTVALKNK